MIDWLPSLIAEVEEHYRVRFDLAKAEPKLRVASASNVVAELDRLDARRLSGRPEIIQLLLPVSDPLVQDSRGRTALMRGAWFGNPETVDQLLEASSCGALTCKSKSAATMARSHGHQTIAKKIESYALAAAERTMLSEIKEPAAKARSRARST